jgi:hypothetical protein
MRNSVASQKAVKTYVDQIVAAQDAMVFKGVIDCSANPNYPAADRGWTYRISVAGKIGGGSGINVEVGDILICLDDGTASGNQATVGTHWSIAQSNLDGAVIGPASAVSGNIATFNGTTGKLIQDSGLALDTDTSLTANSDSKIASQKATKTYVDAAKAAAISTAESYADTGDAATLASANSHSDTNDAVTLAAAEAYTDSTTRPKLTADRTYYVRTDGSNSNDGLSNTSGGAFLTVQHAADIVYGTIDLNGFNATIQVAAGSYAGSTLANFPQVGKGTITILGDATTPSNVVLTGVGGGGAIGVANAASIQVNGFKLIGSGGAQTGCLSATGNAALFHSNIEFGAAAGVSSYHILTTTGGIVQALTGYTISSSAAFHLRAQSTGVIISAGITITLTGSPVFSSGFARTQGGVVQINTNTYVGSTGAGSPRLSVISGYVQILAAVSTIPGDSDGFCYSPNNVAINTTGSSYGFRPSADNIIDNMYQFPDQRLRDMIRKTYQKLIDAGLDTKLGGLWVHCLPTQQDALLNWMTINNTTPRNLSIVGSPVFTANQGFTGDGATAQLQSGIGYALLNGSQNSFCMGTFVVSAGSSNKGIIGSGAVTAARREYLQTGPSGALSVVMNDTTVDTFTPPAYTGMFTATRGASTDFNVYLNDRLVKNIVRTSTTGVDAISFLASQDLTAVEFSDAQIAFSFAGANLSATDVANLYNAMYPFVKDRLGTPVDDGYPSWSFPQDRRSVSLAPTINKSIPATHSFIALRKYTIAADCKVSLGDGAIFKIGAEAGAAVPSTIPSAAVYRAPSSNVSLPDCYSLIAVQKYTLGDGVKVSMGVNSILKVL